MPLSDQVTWAVFLGGQYSDHGTHRVTETEVKKKSKVSLQMLLSQTRRLMQEALQPRLGEVGQGCNPSSQWRQRQEDSLEPSKFRDSQGYRVRLCL